MGLLESHPDEERFAAVLELLHRLDGLGGDDAVHVSLVGHVGTLGCHAAVAEGVCRARGLDVWQRPRQRVVFDCFVAQRMIDFADADGLVALFLESLRHRDDVRIVFAERPHQPPYARMVGIEAREQARTGRAAQRDLTICVVEGDAARRKFVHRRRLRDCVAVGRYPRFHVVDCDQQHVGTVVRGG